MGCSDNFCNLYGYDSALKAFTIAAEDKMRMFLAEKERSEELLNGMLPKYVLWKIDKHIFAHEAVIVPVKRRNDSLNFRVISDKLRRGETILPEVYHSTTVQVRAHCPLHFFNKHIVRT